MIRFLQTESRLTKALFVIVIGAASLAMVVYLIPGLTGSGATATGTYAVVYPHWYNRIFSSGETITQQQVEQFTRRQLMQSNPQYAGNPQIVHMMEPRVAQQLIQQKILLAEAERLGVTANDNDVKAFLHRGEFGEALFPKGQFIGTAAYENLVTSRINMSVADFEEQIRTQIVIQRLEKLVTAGVSVSDKDVRDAYVKATTKIKFDYAVLAADDLRKTINPSDADLDAFFKKNATRYASAVPEFRTIKYFSFTPDQLPGGIPQVSQQEIQQYYNQHQSEFKTDDQARARHILIKVTANADAKADAEAKAKAEGILKQAQGGANFADLAKKYSEDEGSKPTGGELGFAKHGMMVPEFDKAIFSQKIGDVAIVKTQYGYHIIQVEERQTAHAMQMNEVLPQIQATLLREKIGQAETSYANALTSEAIKNGLEKTAAAHHLDAVTTPPVNKMGMIPTLQDSSQIIANAFAAKQSDPPQQAPTGEGFAVFQVAGVTAAHAPNFADWKEHILDDYRNDTLPGLLSAKTKELADKAKAENDLAKAAKEVGATMKSSDLVASNGQVPELGQVAQVAPQLLEMKPGEYSGPINAGRTGVVAKIVDKQTPPDADIAKNMDDARAQMREELQNQAFGVYVSNLMDEYKKSKRIQMNTKVAADQQQQTPTT